MEWRRGDDNGRHGNWHQSHIRYSSPGNRHQLLTSGGSDTSAPLWRKPQACSTGARWWRISASGHKLWATGGRAYVACLENLTQATRVEAITQGCELSLRREGSGGTARPGWLACGGLRTPPLRPEAWRLEGRKAFVALNKPSALLSMARSTRLKGYLIVRIVCKLDRRWQTAPWAGIHHMGREALIHAPIRASGRNAARSDR